MDYSQRKLDVASKTIYEWEAGQLDEAASRIRRTLSRISKATGAELTI